MTSYKIQLQKGRRVEKEHLPYYHKIQKDFKKTGKCPSDKAFTEGIAKAHISEDKLYYNKLNKAGL